MSRLITFGLMGLLMLVVGCKSKDNITATNNKITIKSLNKSIAEAAFDYKWLSAKARVNFDDGNMNQSFTANIRMKKDETIWLSLTGPFGIEGGRVLIDKDSIQIIDRLNKKYYKEPFDFVSNYLPIKVDLGMLQDIFVGNQLQSSLPKQKIADPKTTDNMYRADGQLASILATYFFLPENYRYASVALVEPQNNRALDMKFDAYKAVDGKHFAFERDLRFEDDSRLVNVEMNFNKVRKEDKLLFPFSVPNKYTRMSN